MLILLLIMGPIHPPTADDEEPLGIGPHRPRLADAGVHHRRLHAHADQVHAVGGPLAGGDSGLELGGRVAYNAVTCMQPCSLSAENLP